LSGAPGNPELVYGNAFFPWLQPTAIAAGDSVSVTLQADLVGKDYVWRWESSVLDQGKPDQIKANFKQSDFFGRLWSPKTLRKMEAGYTPTLNEAGQIQQFILEQMDGTASLDEIAHQVSIQFPRRIANQQEALTIVREMSRKFGN
ncbi:MAG TPA: hypothetical protein VEF04_08330, partial [Blastocatellia bacterium]|nr:hypothetical protein [Blastocatellia bacterium]